MTLLLHTKHVLPRNGETIPFLNNRYISAAQFSVPIVVLGHTSKMSHAGTNGIEDPSGSHKRILINAFDMSTVGHLSPGQWKNPRDKSATKRKLGYWIDLAKLLERGGINALFLADTYGGYDTYEGSLNDCIRRAAQWPMTDPTIVSIISAPGELDLEG